jgi:pyrroline-5-carboxylate reductase
MTTALGVQEVHVRVSFIGGGVMAEALIRGLLAAKAAGPEDITVSEPVEERRAYLVKTHGVAATGDNAAAAGQADVVVAAVKPQQIESALTPFQGKLTGKQLLLSIAAGITIQRLQSATGHAQVVRVMPNTPAQVGMGMSVWTATPEVTQEQKANASAILQAAGKEVYVADEHYVDMATAVSGSGPAYVLLFLEALTDAGVHIGLPRDQASLLALQTLAGTAKLVEETGRHPAELRNLVTSPGGTTAEGLLALEGNGMRAAVVQAVIAAYEKSLALGS